MSEQQNLPAPVPSNAGITQEKLHVSLSKYKPTPSQLLWLEAAIEIQDDSPTEISKHLTEMGKQLRRENFYQWKQNPAFAQWWNEQWALILDGIRREAIKIGMRQAKQGRIDFFDRVLEIIHLKSPDPIPGATPPPIQQVNIMADAFFKSAKERGVDVEQQST